MWKRYVSEKADHGNKKLGIERSEVGMSYALLEREVKVLI